MKTKAFLICNLFVLANLATSKSFAEDTPSSPKPTKADTIKSTPEDAGANASNNTGSEINCESKSDKRKLSIVAEGEGCRLDYTKQGETKSVATQKKGDSHCKETLEKIKSKLEGSGLTCK